jgi:hypothetical protein
MTWRPGGIAAVRIAHAGVLLAVAAFCFLSYSPFAYGQFIKPNVVPELNDFVVLSPWLFALTLLVTVLTLLPQLRRPGAPGRGAALAYVAVAAVTAAWALWRRPLITIGNSRAGFLLGLAALAFPVALTWVDHRVWPAPPVRAADRLRAVRSCVATAFVVSAIYAAWSLVWLGRAVGIELTAGAFGIAVAVSIANTVFVFTALLLAVLVLTAVTDVARAPAVVEYWLFVGMLATGVALVFYLLVCASLAFTGRDGAIASAAFGSAVAAVWADIARLRNQRRLETDSLALFASPAAGTGSRLEAGVTLALLPFAAYGLVAAASQLDWNFLLQKLGVLIVWLAALAATYGLVGRRSAGGWVVPALVVSVVALALHAGAARLESSSRVALDRYAALDPSFRLIRDAQTKRSAETAEYYEYLRSQTLVPPRAWRSPTIDFVNGLGPARVRPPHIFLFIVDSLRRDYVSAYNPAVTFTPEIGRLAADSFVFDRAFTRYAGTALAVASLWSGGMTIHTLDQADFARHNTLLKLLDANRYVRMMDFDSVVTELVPNDANAVQLDRGVGTMDVDLCATTVELEARLNARDVSRPAFSYSLPQNVHIAVASRRRVPDAERYPGFFAPVASSVKHVDACVGGFVDFLKRTGLYDDSVIILTSDHGDSLGEQGRWGHAYFMVPEVMRVPLIVHVPPRLRGHVVVDLAALTLSTDIAPSLYALLGYEPADRGPLLGRSAFTAPDGDSSWRRRESFLLASTYGAVYGILRQNGRRMEVVNAVDNEEFAYDVTDGLLGRRIAVTAAAIDANRRAIERQLTELATLYHYEPPH